MANRVSLAVIEERLSALTKMTEEGFAGVHARQDKTNGRIDKNANAINDLQKADLMMTEEIKNHEEKSVDRRVIYDKSHETIDDQLNKLKVKVDNFQRIYYIGIGILIAIEVYLKYFSN